MKKILLTFGAAIAIVGCSTGLTEAEVDLRMANAIAQFEAELPEPLPTATPVTLPEPLPTATPVTLPEPLPTATPVTFPPTPTAIVFPPTPTPVIFPPTPTAIVLPPTPTAIALPTPISGGINIPTDLTVESLTLIDSDGITRATLGMVGEYVEFTMLDTKGLGRVTIASSDSFQQFRLTNEAGGSQFSIHQLDGQPGIALRDTNDQQRLGVSLTKDGNGLIRYDNSSGGPVLSLSGDGDGTGGLHLYNLDGSSIVGSFITMDDGRPGFALFDRFGNIRVFLGVFQNGDAELQIRDSAGGIEALLP